MSKILKLFVGVSVFYLALLLLDKIDVAWYLKPILVPFLIYETFVASDFKTKKLLLIALFFSWVGDVVLMFADKGELFFIFGLVSFLIAHIVFILLFSKQEKVHPDSKFLMGGIALVAVYLLGMLYVLFPSLGDLKIPVAVYSSTISVMFVMAIKGYFNWKTPHNFMVLLGAVFFVCSDSILALNKFHAELPKSGFLIMSTYITAQFLIARGILRLNEKN